jgi:uncharacterized protein
MRRALAAIPLLCALVLAAAAPAQPAFPELTGRVVDQAGLLGARDQTELDAALAEFERETTNQLVVATLTSLQGLSIEEYGYQLGRHWGIGQEGKDNGAILIVAPEERDVRIEVGYGLEGELTDARSRLIIENEILPRFRQGDFAAGIKAGVAAMIDTLGGTYDPALPAVEAREVERAPSPLPLAIMLPIFAIIILNRLSRRRGRGRHRRGYGWPVVVGGGFGGGFGGRRGGSGGRGAGGGFSGGGGGFGGGGASGSW